MKKKIAALGAAILAAALAGCGSGTELPALVGYEETADASYLTDATVSVALDGDEEGYAETLLTYEGPSSGGALGSYVLSGNGFSFRVLLPGHDGYLTDDGKARGEAHGVSVSYSIRQREGDSLFSVLSDAYRSERERVSSLGGVNDVKVPDAVSGDGWAIQEIGYTVGENGAEYAGYSYVKVDITDGLVITTVVTLSGDAADDETEAVFLETLSSVGITVEDVTIGAVTENADEDGEEPEAGKGAE